MQMQIAIVSELQGLNGFSAANLQTNFSTTTDGDGMYQLTVSVSYPFSTIVNWPGIPNHVQINHQVVMRQIR